VLRGGDGEAIGNIRFRPRADGTKGDRGFWLAEPYWKRGLMTEAITAVNDFAFLTLGLDHFFVCNAATNEASRRVKQKTGAELVGFIELAHHGGQSKSERWIVKRGCVSEGLRCWPDGSQSGGALPLPLAGRTIAYGAVANSASWFETCRKRRSSP
jgi:hypothetical protein